MLIHLLVVALVAALVYWIIGMIPLPDILRKIFIVILVVAVVISLLTTLGISV